MNSQNASFWQRFLRRCADHPLACALVLAVLSLAAVPGLTRLGVDAGSDALATADAFTRQAYIEATREFGPDRRTYLYVRDDNLWSPAKLAALERLHDAVRQLPFVERIDDLFTLTTVRSVDGELSVQPLLVHAPPDPQGAEDARTAALADPIAIRNLVSADGKAIAFAVSLREAFQDMGDEAMHDALEQALSQARGELPSLVEIGPLRLQAEIRHGVQRDLAWLWPVSAAALAAVLLAICRRPAPLVLGLGASALSLSWTFGLMGYLGIPATFLSVLLLPLLMLASGSDFVRLASAAERDGDVVDGFAANLGAAPVLTALTLMLGCAGQAFSGIGPVRDFGLMAAFAVPANWLAAVLLVPALGNRLGRLPGGATASGLAGLIAPMRRLPGVRLVVGGLALAVVGGAALVVIAPAGRISLDPFAVLHADNPAVRASERLHEDLAGADVLYVTLDANTEGAFRDPANLQRLAAIQAFIDKLHVFDRSLSLADIVAQANREASGGRSEAYEVPPSRKLVGQYLVLHRPQELEPYVSHDFRRANIVVRHNVSDAAILNRNVRELQSAVAHYAGPAMTTAVLGNGVMASAAADRLLQTEAATAAALLAFVLLAVSLMFTSAKGGGIAMALGAISVLAVLGGMRLSGTPFGPATLLAALVAVAATVQGTSRLFARYSELCRNALDYEAAALAAMKMEAAPMVAVCLTLLAVFGALLLSGFPPVAQFGGLACLAVVLASAINLLVAPVALSRIRLLDLRKMLAVSRQREALEGCTLFAGFSSYQIRKTILISELREYRDGECLIEQGTVGRSMYLIVSGQVEVVRQHEGSEQRLALLKPGDVFGEIGFVHETYRTADVRAAGAVSVLCFDHDRLKKDLALFPHLMAKLNFNISGILGRRLAEAVEARETAAAGRPGSQGVASEAKS